jgi:acetyltransferase
MDNSNRLFIVTNGGGAGVIAADRAADLAIALPKMATSDHWLKHNPIDILGEATPARYQEVITTCLNEKK